jgi:hypothetical protein
MSRTIAIEVFAPTEGLHKELPVSMITPRSTPNVLGNAYYGMVQKDYGTTLFATGTVPAPINFIYEANFPDNTTLQVFSHTGMYKYGAGTYGNDGQVYTGAFSNYWHACIHNDSMIYVNGIDPIQRKAAYNSTGTAMGGLVDTYKARAVVSFKDHLNIYNVTEALSNKPKRVRWTKIGNLTYATSDWNSGTAGAVDLQDADGDILRADKLGQGAVAIYAENSIHIQEWVGGDDVYRFTNTISNIDIPSRRCLAINDALHYVLCRDGIFQYGGGRDFQKISAPIDNDFTSVINASAMDLAFIQYIRPDDELRAYVPTGTATTIDTCYICKISDNYSWYKTKRDYTACGQFSRQAGLTIGQLVGNIGAQNWKFGDYAVRANAPTYLLADTSGRITFIDKSKYSLSYSGTSTAQDFLFDTKDFTAINDIDPLKKDKYAASMYMDDQNRWLSTKVEIKGAGSLTMQYSVDGGNSFVNFPESPLTMNADWTMHELDVDISSERFMVRASNTGLNEVAHIRYMKVEFTPGV